jgi:DNA-binding CsgD family transcriptional regulator
MQQLQCKSLIQGEREVLILVGRGMSNQDIAKFLYMSISNIKRLIHTACVKLGVQNRAQAVIEAMRTGVLVPQDIYSVEELAELLAFMDIETIEAVAPLLKQKLEQVPAR